VETLNPAQSINQLLSRKRHKYIKLLLITNMKLHMHIWLVP